MTRGEALELLGLDSDASLDEAREAYRTLAKTYHPDKNPASNATAMFRIISDAWEVIQNTAEQEHSEAEIRQQQAETEAARRRDAKEAARRRAEAAAKRKRAEEARQQAEKIRKQEKEREKKIKRYFGSWFGFWLFGVSRKRAGKKIKHYCYFLWGIPIGLVLIRDFNFRIQTDTLDFSFAMWAIIYGVAIPFSGWLNGWTIIQIRRSSMRTFYLFFGGIYYVSGLFSLLIVATDRTLLFSQILMLFAFFVFAMPIGVVVVWIFREMISKLAGR